MALPVAEPIPLTDRLIGLVAFAAGLLLLRLPFPRVVSAMTWIKRRRSRPATPQEAESAVAAVRWAGQWWPGRAACMELSIAAMLAAAIRRRAVHWCIGGRLAPYAAHAWIETDTSGPAGEPTNLDRPYLPLLRI